jgi:hypothetical protein
LCPSSHTSKSSFLSSSNGSVPSQNPPRIYIRTLVISSSQDFLKLGSKSSTESQSLSCMCHVNKTQSHLCFPPSWSVRYPDSNANPMPESPWGTETKTHAWCLIVYYVLGLGLGLVIPDFVPLDGLVPSILRWSESDLCGTWQLWHFRKGTEACLSRTCHLGLNAERVPNPHLDVHSLRLKKRPPRNCYV